MDPVREWAVKITLKDGTSIMLPAEDEAGAEELKEKIIRGEIEIVSRSRAWR